MTEGESDILRLASHFRQVAAKSLNDARVDLIEPFNEISSNTEFRIFCKKLFETMPEANHGVR